MSIRLIGLGCTLLLTILVVGCSGSQENGSANNTGSGEEAKNKGEPTPRSEPTVPTGEQTSVSESTSSVAEGTSGPERILPDKWYVDSDGNYVPDFVELAEGYDPEADDCAKEVDCPEPSGASGTSSVDIVSKEQNTLLVLDSSGSMAESIGGGQTKMDAAKEALEHYATATPDFINLGFMVYGHKGSNAMADRAESCKSAEFLGPSGRVDYRTFPRTLDTFRPTGWTPIAGALKEAGNAFSGKDDATNRVILVSDGLETCGGDPVAEARKLADADVEVTIDVVGFDIPRAEEAQLQQIAEVSGGKYATVRSAGELDDYFDEQTRLFSDLIDQYYCMSEHSTDASYCYSGLATDAYYRMSDLATDTVEESGNYGQAEAIREMADKSNAYLNRVKEKVSEANEERLSEISKDMEEVQRRMNQRYNEDVSFSPSCPKSPAYASQGETAPASVSTASFLSADLPTPHPL